MLAAEASIVKLCRVRIGPRRGKPRSQRSSIFNMALNTASDMEIPPAGLTCPLGQGSICLPAPVCGAHQSGGACADYWTSVPPFRDYREDFATLREPGSVCSGEGRCLERVSLLHAGAASATGSGPGAACGRDASGCDSRVGRCRFSGLCKAARRGFGGTLRSPETADGRLPFSPRCDPGTDAVYFAEEYGSDASESDLSSFFPPDRS